MASSNIKLFDENKGNMLSDSEFSISNQRMNGLQTGVASSQLQNKAMYQASLAAYAIAQIMMQNGKNANDTDAVSAFVANLSGTMLQKVYDIATTAEAQAGAATGKWMSPALVKAAIDTLAAKAQNILSDETKALYGLGTDAVPDDALRMLYRAVNYAWKRIQAGYTEKQTPWGSATRFDIAHGASKSACSRTVEYSSEIEINSITGEISLRSPQTVTVTYSDYSTTGELLKGKYVKNTYSAPDGIVFIPSDTSIAVGNGSSVYWVYAAKSYVVSTEITVTGDWSIVYAPDRNAYPDSGFSNGYVYVFLGNILDNVISAAKIETGSYVGTGTYGVDNPNQIVLPFPPQFFAIIPEKSSQNNTSAVIGIPGTLSLKYNAYSGSSDYYAATKIEAIGNVLQWYSNDSAASQLNYNGVTYKYVVLG